MKGHVHYRDKLYSPEKPSRHSLLASLGVRVWDGQQPGAEGWLEEAMTGRTGRGKLLIFLHWSYAFPRDHHCLPLKSDNQWQQSRPPMPVSFKWQSSPWAMLQWAVDENIYRQSSIPWESFLHPFKPPELLDDQKKTASSSSCFAARDSKTNPDFQLFFLTCLYARIFLHFS